MPRGRHKHPKTHAMLYEDFPVCDCGALHAAGSVDEWGCAACGEKGFDDEPDYDDE